jgi:glutamine amidotransferase
MKVGIAALNSSNYKSIGRALNWIEIEYIFIKNSKELNKISHLILPGVSSFGSVINELIDRDLIGGIEKLKNLGMPILGLCAGMQIMGESSEESPGVAGLKWFNFKVETIIPDFNLGTRSFHTGWNDVYDYSKNSITALPGVFYFNHSFYVRKLPENEIYGKTEHGQMFASIIRKENIIGAQFHPEKSQSKGLEFLENFIKLKNA